MKSLDTVNKLEKSLKQFPNKGPWYDIYLFQLNEFILIKQDLEKYDAIIRSLKDLFSKIMIDSEFDEYCECENFYVREFGASSNYGISEDLYEVLKCLERMCDNA